MEVEEGKGRDRVKEGKVRLEKMERGSEGGNAIIGI